jgi:serine phosphatase RsbU (regulator of sigma subunit)
MASKIVTKQLPESGGAVGPNAIFRKFRGVRVGGVTLPMPPSPVGGDSVGASAVRNGFVSFVTDGQGKGMIASHLGAMMRHCVLSAISRGISSPTAILHKLNRTLLHEQIFGGAAILHCDGCRLTVSVAGFPAPVLFHPDGRMEQFPITGTLLGLSPFPEFDCCNRDIVPSMFVAIFSDGVTEAEAPDGELFAVERFGEILSRDRSLAANLLDCVSAVLTHSGQQRDDLSLLIARADGLPATISQRAFGIGREHQSPFAGSAAGLATCPRYLDAGG